MARCTHVSPQTDGKQAGLDSSTAAWDLPYGHNGHSGAPWPQDETPVTEPHAPLSAAPRSPSGSPEPPAPGDLLASLWDPDREGSDHRSTAPLLNALLAGVFAASRTVALYPEDDDLPERVARDFQIALQDLPSAPPTRLDREPLQAPRDSGSTPGLTLVPLEWRHGRARPRDAGPVGSVFGIWRPNHQGPLRTALTAAGVAVYGSHTGLLLALGARAHLLRMDPATGRFLLARRDIRVPERQNRFAFKAEECRLWSPSAVAFGAANFVDSTLPYGVPPDIRRIRCLSAEAYRIVQEGGLYLRPHPVDEPAGGGHRLLAEAAPVAWIMEAAGGRACDGSSELLDQPLPPADRGSGLVFGSANLLAAFQASRNRYAEDEAPLFGRRGLFLP